MADLQELYQQLVIDHGRHPRHFGKLADVNHTKEGYNPLCGDRLMVYIREEKGVIQEAQFEGSGCAISMASASLMMETIRGKSLLVIDTLFTDFHDAVTGKSKPDPKKLGKLAALSGVSEFPARVKCATLCWHTVIAALKNNKELITTE